MAVNMAWINSKSGTITRFSKPVFHHTLSPTLSLHQSSCALEFHRQSLPQVLGTLRGKRLSTTAAYLRGAST